MLSIQTAIGGWILYLDMDECYEDLPPMPEVFGYDDESENSKGELEAMRTLLYRVAEELGVIFSKHNAYNLKISIVDNNFDEIA